MAYHQFRHETGEPFGSFETFYADQGQYGRLVDGKEETVVEDGTLEPG